MIPIILYEQHQTYTAPVPTGCVNEGARKLDGTGPHLGLQAPWWNDDIHTLTDSTLFRWLLVVVVIDHIWQRLK